MKKMILTFVALLLFSTNSQAYYEVVIVESFEEADNMSACLEKLNENISTKFSEALRDDALSGLSMRIRDGELPLTRVESLDFPDINNNDFHMNIQWSNGRAPRINEVTGSIRALKLTAIDKSGDKVEADVDFDLNHIDASASSASINKNITYDGLGNILDDAADTCEYTITFHVWGSLRNSASGYELLRLD